MSILSFLLALTPIEQAHPCIGDFVYRGGKDEVSIGLRIRTEPDVAELLFSDFGNVISNSIEWSIDRMQFIDNHDFSTVKVECKTNSAVLTLPASEYVSERSFSMRRTTGSLWDVDKREGWNLPKH
ncbi:hypothetical protein MNBD_ALPHA04-117 [hydrothermal vent metagenome]|uniref:Uncharacterized protein n=1 Tax=hydrothermal vent metagenome TaxID=652676 RepID=A0A3B0R974_9ZZZZ